MATTTLRFTRTDTGFRAITGDLGFTTYKTSTGTYRLRAWSLVTIDGDKFLDAVTEETHCDRLADAKGVAAAYAADTDRPVYLNRMTHAVSTYYATV